MYGRPTRRNKALLSKFSGVVLGYFSFFIIYDTNCNSNFIINGVYIPISTTGRFLCGSGRKSATSSYVNTSSATYSDKTTNYVKILKETSLNRGIHDGVEMTSAVIKIIRE